MYIFRACVHVRVSKRKLRTLPNFFFGDRLFLLFFIFCIFFFHFGEGGIYFI